MPDDDRTLTGSTDPRASEHPPPNADGATDIVPQEEIEQMVREAHAGASGKPRKRRKKPPTDEPTLPGNTGVTRETTLPGDPEIDDTLDELPTTLAARGELFPSEPELEDEGPTEIVRRSSLSARFDKLQLPLDPDSLEDTGLVKIEDTPADVFPDETNDEDEDDDDDDLVDVHIEYTSPIPKTNDTWMFWVGMLSVIAVAAIIWLVWLR